ncbi:hypothetical protein TRVL_04252 [Trypanosoma vivax]|nr:hypothetical protein TRVL_04252 [Trypanosoma vivax]
MRIGARQHVTTLKSVKQQPPASSFVIWAHSGGQAKAVANKPRTPFRSGSVLMLKWCGTGIDPLVRPHVLLDVNGFGIRLFCTMMHEYLGIGKRAIVPQTSSFDRITRCPP